MFMNRINDVVHEMEKVFSCETLSFSTQPSVWTFPIMTPIKYSSSSKSFLCRSDTVRCFLQGMWIPRFPPYWRCVCVCV